MEPGRLPLQNSAINTLLFLMFCGGILQGAQFDWCVGKRVHAQWYVSNFPENNWHSPYEYLDTSFNNILVNRKKKNNNRKKHDCDAIT